MSLTNLNQPSTQLSNYSLSSGTKYRPWSSHEGALIPMRTDAQQQILKLSQQALLSVPKKGPLKDLKERLNHSYTWEVSRIQALMTQILSTDTVTEQDQAKLGRIEKDLSALKAEVLQNQTLSAADKTKAQKLIDEAQKLLLETGDLCKYLKYYNLQAEGLDQASQSFLDTCYDPEGGEVLSGLPTMRQVFDLTRRLGQDLLPLANEKYAKSAAGQHLLRLYSLQVGTNAAMVGDWKKGISAYAQQELNILHRLSQHKDQAVRQSAYSQMQALKDHLAGMQQQVAGLRVEALEWQKPWNSVDSVKESMQHTIDLLEELEDDLNSFVEGFALQLEKSDLKTLVPVKYNSEGWHELVKQRPVSERSWMGRLWDKTTYLNPLRYIPDKWKPALKVAGVALGAMVVIDQAIKYSKIPQRVEQQRLQKTQMQLQVFKAVSAEATEQIERETGSIGKILEGNYGALSDKRFIEKMDRKFGGIGSTLEEAVRTFGTNRPSSEEITKIMDAHRTHRMFQESPIASPFQSMSFTNWWHIFTNPEKAEAALISEAPHEASAGAAGQVSIRRQFKASQPEAEPQTSAATRSTGLVLSMMAGLGALFSVVNWFSQKKNLPPKATEGHQALRMALESMPTLHQTINATPALAALQAEANLLHEQLLNAVAETPKPQCSLHALAFWSQRVEDVCYALKDIQARMAKAMDALHTTPPSSMLTSKAEPSVAASETTMIVPNLSKEVPPLTTTTTAALPQEMGDNAVVRKEKTEAPESITGSADTSLKPVEELGKKRFVFNNPGSKSGMFATFLYLLGALDKYEKHSKEYSGLEINFGTSGVYYDAARGDDWWSYYFEPVQVGKKEGEAELVDRKVERWDYLNSIEVNYEGTGQPMPREIGYGLFQKYFHLKPEIQKKIDEFAARNFGDKPVVSVHYRGTDKAGSTNDFEAPRITYEEVAENIKKEISERNIKDFKLFVATDEQAFVEFMKQAFPGRVVTTDAERSTDGKPLHLGSKDPYKAGESALIDCFLLAKATLMFKTSSNLSFFAKHVNPNMSVVEMTQRREGTTLSRKIDDLRKKR